MDSQLFLIWRDHIVPFGEPSPIYLGRRYNIREMLLHKSLEVKFHPRLRDESSLPQGWTSEREGYHAHANKETRKSQETIISPAVLSLGTTYMSHFLIPSSLEVNVFFKLL